MPGLAILDHQPEAARAAVWIVARDDEHNASSVNAVVVELAAGKATDTIADLIAGRAVILTEGSSPDGLAITGTPLIPEDVDALLDETRQLQECITDAVQAHKRRTRSKTLVEPFFNKAPHKADFHPREDTPQHRALALANYAAAAWQSWLITDMERLRRTVAPRTNKTPWIMPEDLNQAETSDFPPRFATKAVEQPPRTQRRPVAPENKENDPTAMEAVENFEPIPVSALTADPLF